MSSALQEEQFGMSLDEFMQRYEEEPFELLEGEFIPVTPQIPRSSRIAFRLARFIADVAESNGLGEALPETPFVLKASKKWVKGSRVPDVMFIRAERLKTLAESDPDWELTPLPIAPDVVAEVMSPTDRLSSVTRKVKRYLQDGVKLAWIIDPERRAVLVYQTGSEVVTLLTDEDKLSGGDLIPGFEIDIIKLFE